MSMGAVLDACVLFPASLRDILVRLSELELYDVAWSDRILHEATRNLVGKGLMTQEKADKLARQLTEVFEGSEVNPQAVTDLETVMTNDPGDRHVLATAVSGRAELIVTHNLRHFPAAACDPHGVRPMHPDEFLQILLAKAPNLVVKALTSQAEALRKPPMTLEQVLDSLATQVPQFVERVRALHASSADPGTQ